MRVNALGSFWHEKTDQQTLRAIMSFIISQRYKISMLSDSKSNKAC
jgi:hypothetical protein